MFSHSDFHAEAKAREARVAERAKKLLPAAREVIAERIAAGLVQGGDPETLAKELARWDADKDIRAEAKAAREAAAVRKEAA